MYSIKGNFWARLIAVFIIAGLAVERPVSLALASDNLRAESARERTAEALTREFTDSQDGG